MKKTRSAAVLAILMILYLTAGFPMPVLGAESYNVDPAHTYIMFRAKHLDIGYSYGRFNEPSGRFTFDDANPSNNMIEMTVEAKNLDTDNEKRDKHLRSPDFFDTESHPRIAFKSKSIKKVNPNNYEVFGDLTLLGTTKPVTLTAVATGEGKDPWGNYRRGFETTFTIKRSDFGMNFMLDGVSDEVELTVSVEGIRQ